jgi:carbamoyl-phosphate synthase small subunit
MGGVLLLEDGRTFLGEAFGASVTRIGESVFNTAMTGYQEVLTDPSYTEQIVAMTYPHIGNTGMNEEDPESEKVWVAGFVVRSLTRMPSNFRSAGGLHQYLVRHGVPGLQGIDTRALVRHLRSRGAMRCAISTDGTPIEALRQQILDWPGMEGRALATEVCCTEAYEYANPPSPRIRLAVIDGGVKRNILRLLAEAGAYVRVHPITDSVEAWTRDVDALFLSNGPGDPAALTDAIAKLKQVVGRMPMLGICLGHQLLGLALGASTYKLKFGHRGANHPVRDMRTGRIEITSQNHGFAVDEASLRATGGEVSHVNLNDHTVSGFIHRQKRVMCVQYHPESAPGPHDSRPLILDEFIRFAQGEQL